MSRAIRYTEGFKKQMVRRMLGPGLSASALARETGMSQPLLSQWLREARTVVEMPSPDERTAPGTGPREWSAKEKLRILAAAQELESEALGALLRREGVYESQLRQWQEAAATALSGSEVPLTHDGHKKLTAAQKRVKELERELLRKDRALAETAALLVLEKKLKALGWDEQHQGDEDDESDGKSET